MRVWVDMTAPAHVLVLRPIIERLRERGPRGRGHRARLRADPAAARAARHRAHAVGRHGGASRVGKAGRLASADRADEPLRARPRLRPRARARLQRPGDRRPRCSASPRRTCTTTSSRSPSTTRLPAGPPRDRSRTRSRRAAARASASAPEKLVQYPGLKEEYYLSDFEPDPEVLDAARGRYRSASLVVVRPPPDVSLYHRKSNPLFPQVLERLGSRRGRARRRAAAHRRAARRS